MKVILNFVNVFKIFLIVFVIVIQSIFCLNFVCEFENMKFFVMGDGNFGIFEII